jgi:crotonobetainyl-CoA:carnitine CoA-transferase CaiB-like acyl-CoA transferase
MTIPIDGVWPLDAANVGTGLPLEGIRILDLSQVLAAPLATMIAADLGADVIKVEPPNGDLVRGFSPPTVDDVATYYLAVNRNRRSVVADLRTTAGRELVRSLMTCADAVVENYLPSRAADFGIDLLKEEFQEVVWVTVAPAAEGGPLGDEPSFDLLAQARSGLMGITGSSESGPMKVGAPLADVVTGLYACIGLLSGLFARLRQADRPGLRVEAPLLESTIASLINQAAGFLATGERPGLLGNEHPSIAPYATYATSDLDILLAVGTDGQFRSLCEALGTEALADDPRFALNVDRVAHRTELREVLEEIMTTRPSAAWLERFGEHKVPCAPVNDVAAALSQDQITGGDLVVDVALETGSTIKMVSSPLRLDGVRPPVRRPPPSKGQHTEELSRRQGETS